MSTSRRDLFKLGALAAGAALLPRLASASTGSVEKAARPLRILILGGTGFTGPFQVNYALARGHKVTLFNRGKRASPEWPGEVEQLFGDRETGDLKALEGREWDVCIDNPTSVPYWVRDVGEVLRGKVGQYVFISTISVYASYAQPQDETGALAQYKGKDVMAETRETLIANMGDLYGPLKAACEATAEKYFPGKTTIIRPGYIVGARDETDRFTYWPLRVRDGGDVLVPGDGSDPVQFIDARDLAEWTIRMVENNTTGIFNATGPDYPLSTDAFLHGVRAVTGGRANFVHVPTAFLRGQNIGFGSDLPIWAPSEGDSAGFARIDVQRAINAGLTFRPLADTVRDLLAWWDALPAERRAQPRAGMKPERQAELLAAWKAAKPA